MMFRSAISVPFLVMCIISSMLSYSITSGYARCPFPPGRQIEAEFNQKVDRFWEFDVQSNAWVEISLPFSLISCVNEICQKVGSIEITREKNSTPEGEPSSKVTDWRFEMNEKKHEQILPVRKRISLSRMSETSVWLTGQSGAIYERFWNGVNWVVAPHSLPTSAGSAVSVFFVNQTILALSESGVLFQLQLNENSQPIWNELMLISEENTRTESEPIPTLRMKAGVTSSDGERLYLCTKDGSLVEIIQFHPLRWNSHGHPPGGDVSAVVDTGTIRPGVLFTVSSSGDLYEFDDRSKPSWRKHIWNEESTKFTSLKPAPGHALHGLGGSHSASLFLLSKDGLLIERRLQKRKWKWVVHGTPKDHYLSAITSAQESRQSEKISSLFCTTTSGDVFEYQLSMHPGSTHGKQPEDVWINHMHPPNAKVAQGVHGVEVHAGRLMFQLDDGRPAELHFPGSGGEHAPTHLSGLRSKASGNKYEWSVLEAPETEGWNAEYCSDERGPFNCMEGTSYLATAASSSRRWKAQKHEHYINMSEHENVTAETYNFLTASVTNNFRMRVLHPDRSFFYVTDDGLTFEYLQTDDSWIWLRHEHPTAMKSAVGGYNGSLFLVDAKGNLLMRERSDEGLSWLNCTAMRKGRQVHTGPPWDEAPIKGHRVTADDALFFVSKDGTLLEFTVAQEQFKWKDCHNPPETRIAYVVDQEAFRANIVFAVGRNGHLYQYNRVTELWHKHYQSPHLVLSRSPGTAVRPSSLSLAGSIFMFSEDGGLIEYHWDAAEGWEWVEHGTPCRDVSLVGAPGPCFDSVQLFVVGKDGDVYRRHLEQGTWRWTSHGHPQADASGNLHEYNNCAAGDGFAASHDSGAQHRDLNCDEKVAPVRPIPFSENSVVFELQDGRLAELRRSESETDWRWARIIGTPTSPCATGYWTAVAT